MNEEQARSKTLELRVPEQGIDDGALDASQAAQWLRREVALWSDLPIPDSFRWESRNHGTGDIRGGYIRRLQEIERALRSTDDPSAGTVEWNEFLQLARQGKVLIQQGVIGERVQTLLADKPHAMRGLFLVVAFSEPMTPAGDPGFYDLLRAALVDNPWVFADREVTTAIKARQLSEASAARVQATLTEVENTLVGARESLAQLEFLYHTKLMLEGPSRHWRDIAEAARRGKWVAFGSFCVLLVAPAGAIAWWWLPFSEYVDHLVKETAGGLSLAGIAVITVPVLAYGWLLKHVSRSYLQNMSIETDARHRRVMITTFLGLAKRKSVNMQETDRALILNALFRPAPPHTGDEGPPNGLIDLITKR